jgi:hypothetical protein
MKNKYKCLSNLKGGPDLKIIYLNKIFINYFYNIYVLQLFQCYTRFIINNILASQKMVELIKYLIYKLKNMVFKIYFTFLINPKLYIIINKP